MGSFSRALRYLKDFWKVFIRGENDDLRLQTRAIEEQLARMRNQRVATESEQEAAALNQARTAVEKLRELHDSLLLAEKAASEFAGKIGELAKSNLEAEEEVQRKLRMKFFMQQKQFYLQGQGTADWVHSSKQDEVEKGATDKDNDSPSRRIGDMVENTVENQAAKSFTDEEHTSLNATVTLATDKDDRSSSRRIEGNMVENAPKTSLDATVTPEMIDHVMSEARKQARLDEKAHLEALERNKAILEKAIEAEEQAQHKDDLKHLR